MIRSTKEMREEVKRYVEMKSDQLNAYLESEKAQEGFSPEIKRILREYRLDSELWRFLKDRYASLLKIENWEDYCRAAESVKEIPIPIPTNRITYREKMLDILRDMMQLKGFLDGLRLARAKAL